MDSYSTILVKKPNGDLDLQVLKGLIQVHKVWEEHFLGLEDGSWDLNAQETKSSICEKTVGVPCKWVKLTTSNRETKQFKWQEDG